MDRIFTLLFVLFFTALLFSCGGDAVDNEDWYDYADVFSGPGPEDDYEKLYIKLNYEKKGKLSGEMEGPFFTKVRGTYKENASIYQIEINTSFRSTHCFGTTYIEFDGTIVNDKLSGTMFYQGCSVYDFYYNGSRVGGAGR